MFNNVANFHMATSMKLNFHLFSSGPSRVLPAPENPRYEARHHFKWDLTFSTSGWKDLKEQHTFSVTLIVRDTEQPSSSVKPTEADLQMLHSSVEAIRTDCRNTRTFYPTHRIKKKPDVFTLILSFHESQWTPASHASAKNSLGFYFGK